jgi:hypothetical protein
VIFAKRRKGATCLNGLDPRSLAYTPFHKYDNKLFISFVESTKRGARLQWQSQPRCLGREPGCVDIEQGKNYGQASAGIEINLFIL